MFQKIKDAVDKMRRKRYKKIYAECRCGHAEISMFLYHEHDYSLDHYPELLNYAKHIRSKLEDLTENDWFRLNCPDDYEDAKELLSYFARV